MNKWLTQKQRGAIGGNIVAVSALPGLIIVMNGAAMLLIQIVDFLKTGTWTPHPIFATLHQVFGMEYPRPSWWAVQKIARLLLAAPASITLVVFGFALSLLAVFLLGWLLEKLNLLPEDEEPPASPG